MHPKHVESLKWKLKDYNIGNIFGSSPAIHVSSGKEIDTSIVEELMKASELSEEKYLIKVKERLLK